MTPPGARGQGARAREKLGRGRSGRPRTGVGLRGLLAGRQASTRRMMPRPTYLPTGKGVPSCTSGRSCRRPASRPPRAAVNHAQEAFEHVPPTRTPCRPSSLVGDRRVADRRGRDHRVRSRAHRQHRPGGLPAQALRVHPGRAAAAEGLPVRQVAVRAAALRAHRRGRAGRERPGRHGQDHPGPGRQEHPAGRAGPPGVREDALVLRGPQVRDGAGRHRQDQEAVERVHRRSQEAS